MGGIRWNTEYTYRVRNENYNISTMQVEELTHTIGGQTLSFTYEYDNIGQITRWFDPVNRMSHFYRYDVQNQLTTERIGLGHPNGYDHTFHYTYDTFGNIRKRQHWDGPSDIVSPQTMTFSYDYDLWPDLLTAVNGRPIMYDRSGNPALWHDGREFTWERGRQLTHIQPGEASPPDVLEVEFEYDVNGIRTRKIVTHPDGTYTNHTFYTQGGRIVAERREFSDDRVHTLEFFYDEAGRPVQVFFCNGDRFQRVYNYVLNLQGDVIEIRNADNGIVVAKYLYNAWGELLESYGWFAEYNPLRYRGKFYCQSSGFYYLQTRYYCPTIGRFINADEYISTGQGLLGYNMFAYTGNNPVNRVDHDGRAWAHFRQSSTMGGASPPVTQKKKPNPPQQGKQKIPPAAPPTTRQGMQGPARINAGSRQLTWNTARLHSYTKNKYINLANAQAQRAIIAQARQIIELRSISIMHAPAFPGFDPAKSPGGNFEWRGRGVPGSPEGSWFDPKTKEVWRPDLSHGLPIGPHWDWRPPDSIFWYRVFPNGSIIRK